MNSLSNGLTRYFSSSQLQRLHSAHIGIIGAGGLGSNVATMLVRSGIRHLTLIDYDTVDASNLNRQAFIPIDVGIPKVTALAGHLRVLEPALELTLHQCEVTVHNAERLMKDCSIIVEAVDDAATKVMLYEIFAPHTSFYVTASGMGGFGQGEITPMRIRRLGNSTVAVGDFSTAADEKCPPLAPRVMQAAAMQADAVLTHILS